MHLLQKGNTGLNRDCSVPEDITLLKSTIIAEAENDNDSVDTNNVEALACDNSVSTCDNDNDLVYTNNVEDGTCDNSVTTCASSEKPMDLITSYTNHDVILGKGAQFFRFPGNLKYQRMCQQAAYVFQTCTSKKAVTDKILQNILNGIHMSNGRFLIRQQEGHYEVAPIDQVMITTKETIDNFCQKTQPSAKFHKKKQSKIARKTQAENKKEKERKIAKMNTNISLLSSNHAILFENSLRISLVHENDVISGKGIGSQNLHEYCRELLSEYVHAPRYEKRNIKQSIINMVQSLTPPGRFLGYQQDGSYIPLSLEKVEKKIENVFTYLKMKEYAPTSKDNWKV